MTRTTHTWSQNIEHSACSRNRHLTPGSVVSVALKLVDFIMDLYHLFFFAAFLVISAKPVPDTTLDPLLPDIILAERPEDWKFGQQITVNSLKQDQAGSLQITGLDAFQQDQTRPMDSAQLDKSGSFPIVAAEPVQSDQSGSFQIAAADAIRPVYLDPGLEQKEANAEAPLYSDLSDDAFSALDPIETDGDYILATKPNRPQTPRTPRTPVARPRVKKRVCPSNILGARACCNGPEQDVTTIPGLSELILGYVFVTRCDGCMFPMPRIQSESF